LSLYPPERIAFQRARYEEVLADAGAELLENTDRQPKALLYTLLVVLRQAGVGGVARALPAVLEGGPWIAAAALLVCGLLRLLYRLRSSRRGRDPAADALDGGLLVLATGAAGMGVAVWLMFAYQARFGSLFLHVGLISALFMLGSWLGSLALERGLRGRAVEPAGVFPGLILVHLVFFAAAVATIPDAPLAAWGALVPLAGALTGAYFPLAAHRLRAAGRDDATAGAALETADHFGAAAGAVLTGLVLLPLFGSTVTAALLALLVAINLAPAVARTRAAAPSVRFDGALRPAGYVLFGLGVLALGASWLCAELGRRGESRALADAACAMIGVENPEETTALAADGTAICYFTGRDPADGAEAFVFGSAGLAPGVHGYGGPVELAVCLDRAGRLRDVRVLRSRETPAYLEQVFPGMRALVGRELFAPDPFAGVDTVSGATLTCRAVHRTLAQSARAFGAAALGFDPGAASTTHGAERPRPIAADFGWLAGFFAAAIALRFRPHRWVRRVFLLGVLLVLGVSLNLQLATQHVFALLAGDLPVVAASAAFFLVAVVPLLTVLVGNVYCGWVCPFGALQELLGELKPRRLATDPGKAVWRHGRFVKYGLLFVLVLVFAATRDPAVLAADPLTTVFSAARGGATLGIAIGALALALVFRRFWCRNLCPAGAFLSLLGGLRLLRRLSPDTRPAACDLGVRHTRELDCLRCDRCRHAKS
ncbi:MAG: 4Fe-4S binding protein, partial [Planctomycetes bacterium]|nr:4Fe-4S binding protein [Planctomycetota bacterium]